MVDCLYPCGKLMVLSHMVPTTHRCARVCSAARAGKAGTATLLFKSSNNVDATNVEGKTAVEVLLGIGIAPHLPISPSPHTCKAFLHAPPPVWPPCTPLQVAFAQGHTATASVLADLRQELMLRWLEALCTGGYGARACGKADGC